MFRLVRWHRHHANISYHVAVVYSVIVEITLVVNVENIKQLRALPNGVCAKDEIVFVVAPFYISDTKVVIFWHFQRTTSSLHIFSSCAFSLCPRLFNVLMKVVHYLIVYAHLNLITN